MVTGPLESSYQSWSSLAVFHEMDLTSQSGPLWESCSQEERGPLLLVKKTAGFK